MNAVAEHEPLRGEMRLAEPMARHTVWGIGGPARRFYRPADVDDLGRFLAGLDAGEPLLWLGLGSNVLVRDGGVDATVVDTGRLSAIERVAPARVRAEAGAPCPRIARRCVGWDLGGCEFFAGIPGSLGGALAMNAGAFGGDTWSVVRAVETVDRGGRRRRRPPSDFRYGYRSVSGPPGEWFVGAEMDFAPGGGESAAARIKALLAQRAATQPVGQRSCGSVFKNPPGDHAARLIDGCGLKGTREGGAVISEKHANFIVNTGSASAADVERLMARIVDRVHGETGVRLEAEVRVVGEPAAAAEGST